MQTQREFTVVLQNGRTAEIKAVKGDEETRIAEVLGMERVSEGGARKELERQGCAAAWAAFVATDGGWTAIGLARYVRSVDDPSADVEVKVAEAFRGIGLGKLLFETLILNALEHGLDVLVARVARRSAMVERLSREASRVRASGGDVRMEIPVSSGRRTIRASSAVRRVRRSKV